MFAVLYLSCFLLIVSMAFPPLLLVTIPLLVISGRKVLRTAREQRAAMAQARQVMAHRAYMAELRRRAAGGEL